MLSKIWHKCTYLQNRNRFTDREQACGASREGCRGGMEWEFAIWRCKFLWIEWINNKVLLYSTGNHIQYSEINHNGKEYKQECGNIDSMDMSLSKLWKTVKDRGKKDN